MTIKERTKDLCSEISNILMHHYKGHTTEFAETKAVEDAEELINTIKQDFMYGKKSYRTNKKENVKTHNST